MLACNAATSNPELWACFVLRHSRRHVRNNILKIKFAIAILGVHLRSKPNKQPELRYDNRAIVVLYHLKYFMYKFHWGCRSMHVLVVNASTLGLHINIQLQHIDAISLLEQRDYWSVRVCENASIKFVPCLIRRKTSELAVYAVGNQTTYGAGSLIRINHIKNGLYRSLYSIRFACFKENHFCTLLHFKHSSTKIPYTFLILLIVTHRCDK